MDIPVLFGEWVQLRRKALDLTQVELAQRTGCSRSALRKIESGERRPSQQLAELLAIGLNIAPEDRAVFIKVARGVLNLERLGLPYPQESIVRGIDKPSLTRGPNLPAQPMPLIGREPELMTLGRLLKDPACRLVTIVGLAGMGKTRLAIEAAKANRTTFSDNTYFVSLSPLASPEFIIPAIADTLGLTFYAGTDPISQLYRHLNSQNALLILDNLEHLLSGVELISDLLRHVPNIKLLVTSHERLNLQEEWVFDLQGLPRPPSGLIEGVENYSSVGLFVQNARRVKSSFALGHDNSLAIARICQLVDGLPLAIELAAAWVPVLSCQAIAEEIERNLDVLTSTMHNIPQRHRSIRAAFDHSWSMLSVDERPVLAALSIFQGGFDRGAADYIASASLPLLRSFASRSMLIHNEDERFDMHPLLRQYAAEYFSIDPQAEAAVRERHSTYFLTLLSKRAGRLRSAAQRTTLREISTEIDNLRTAWDWAVMHQEWQVLMLALDSFGWFYDIRGSIGEGIEQINLLIQVLTNGDGTTDQALLGRTYAVLGFFHFRQGMYTLARQQFESGIKLLRAHNYISALPEPLILSGVVTYLMGDYDLAGVFLDEGLALAQSQNDRWYTALALTNQGIMAHALGEDDLADEKMRAGLDLWRQIGEPRTIGLALNFLSPLIIKLGYPAEAQVLLEESLALNTSIGDRWGIATACNYLGLAAQAQGNLEGAHASFLKALGIFTELDVRWDMARASTNLAKTLIALGESAQARELLIDTLQMAIQAEAKPGALDALVGWALLHVQTDDGIEYAYGILDCIAKHQANTGETRDQVQRLRAKISPRLSSLQMQRAEAWAGDQTLETIISEILSHTL